MPYVGILTSVLGYVSTEHYSYQELFHEVNIQTGGIASSINVYGDAKEYRAYTPVYTVRAKALYGQMPSVFALLGEILFTSQLEDEKRLKEILSRLKSRLQASLVSAGHSAAAMRAMSYTSGLAAYTDSTSGIAYYELVEDLEQHFEEKKAELMENLKELMIRLFRPENLLVHYTAQRCGQEALLKELRTLQPACTGKLFRLAGLCRCRRRRTRAFSRPPRYSTWPAQAISGMPGLPTPARCGS